MGAYPISRLFTLEEYLMFERVAPTKSECIGGVIYTINGANRGQNAITGNTLVNLEMRLGEKGCRAHSSDVRVSLSNDGPHFYSDGSVVCPRDDNWHDDMVSQPTLVSEVFSDSTQRFDRDVKINSYKKTPSIQHILLISQWKIDIEHHHRLEPELWDVRRYSSPDENIPVKALSLELPVAAAYRGMKFT